MATWNPNISSGGFLGGIGQVNSNAPSASDINPTLGLIRENNDLQRSGANNWGLQGLAGLSGVAQVMNEQKQQERLKEFQGKWGQAYANGDRTAMRQLMAEYPDQAEKITSGMSGISDDVKESIGNIASGYRLAVGTGKATDYIRQNADEFRRLGIDPQGAASMAEQDPKAAMELADHIGMSALGMDKYYDVRDKMEGRVIERDKLAEDARQADMTNARGWANIKESQLDRAQRAQIHSDNMGVKMIELSQKQAESGKIDPSLVKGINSDITSFGKNYNAVRTSTNSLEKLSSVKNGATQLAIIFNYMKSLDPQSVVREGEQVQVMRSDGIFGQMKGYVDQLSSGTGLSDEAITNIVGAAKINSNAIGEEYNRVVDEYLDSYGDSLPSAVKNGVSKRKAKLYDIPKNTNSPANVQSKLTADDEALLNKYL
ncbi:phage DNA ejection protein [Providencia sp. PROV111]|uniref:phage DNA ejection protein n=1 Tax=Providencia sp. PROV111 TaxID=2949822 RepID=UPI002349C6DA|nr:phage DNA ejection protein [Providencia sp. PROV111]